MTDAATIMDETGTQRLVGYVIELPGGGVARVRLVVDERHLNRTGVLHGGILATLLDSASGVTASLTVDDTGRQPFVTLALTTNFLAPCPPGVVMATARVVGGGRATLFVEGRIDHADGTLIATSSGVFRRAASGGSRP